jgi:hypothetical protein
MSPLRTAKAAVSLILLTSACGGGSGSSTPTSPTPPTPTTAGLSGRVTESVGTTPFPIEGATLTVADGANAGRTANTNANGDYQFSGLQRGGFTVNVTASGYQTQGFGVDLTGDMTRNFTLSPTGPRTRFGAGTYRIGSDIAAGRYFSDTSDGCYWERLRGFGGTLSDIIANDFVGYNALQYIVDVRSSDLAFAPDSDCGTWFKDSPRQPAQSTIPPGVWLVGAQIAPGTYQISAGAGCYWERLRNFEHVLSSIIANDFSSSAGSQFVTISQRDVGFQNDGDCGTWSRALSVESGQKSDLEGEHSPLDIERHWNAYQRKIAGRR